MHQSRRVPSNHILPLPAPGQPVAMATAERREPRQKSCVCPSTCRQARASAVRPGAALPAPAWVEPPHSFPGKGFPASPTRPFPPPPTGCRHPPPPAPPHRTVQGGAVCLRNLGAGSVGTMRLRAIT
ncbi:hypothetical protein P7K49_016109 [Saguinus oedipus]|uniref:Uncharacterized protein n=1 Tax=Saguinus oedipus TaxID=9490 RepID=A0ABQ9VB57_SAGOE|nr:hypothetical protein P7K49_016109 [Saguinus oedipus]